MPRPARDTIQVQMRIPADLDAELRMVLGQPSASGLRMRYGMLSKLGTALIQSWLEQFKTSADKAAFLAEWGVGVEAKWDRETESENHE